MAALSPRARRLLHTATCHEVERDPEAIAGRLRECGRPAFGAVVDFERSFGGLVWGGDALGIAYEEPLVDETDPLRLDETHVPIGWVGVLGLFMNEAGEVITQPNAKSSSIESFLEQWAMTKPPPRYRVKVRPVPGAALAHALNLDPVREATDAYQDWWETSTVRMRHIRQPELYEAGADVLWATSLDAVFAILTAARGIDASTRVAVLGTPSEWRTCTEDEMAPVESWASRTGAVRFAYGDEDERRDGVVWMLPQEHQIQQYVESGRRSWASYSAEVDVFRTL